MSEALLLDMNVDTLVKDCRIVTQDGITQGSIGITDGKIASVTSDAAAPQGGRIIDAKGRYVLPGIIDPHVHYQKAYYTTEELVRSETASAAAGGVTTVGAFWFERENPDAPYREVFPRGIKTVKANAVSDVILHGDLFTREQADEVPAVAKEYGVTSFKIFMAYKGPEAAMFGVRGIDDGLIVHALRRIASVGSPGMCMIHTENMEIIDFAKEEVKKAGRNDLAAWNDARPGYAEEENLRRAIFFGQVTGATMYIVHHSGCDKGRGVDVIAEAKKKGAKLYAETLSAYLSFTKDDTAKAGLLAKNNPPVRDRESLERLWWGLNNGVIDCVGSDHSTIMPREKRLGPDLWTTISGFPGTETILPVMLSEGVNKGRISLQKLVEVCSYNTARILGVYPRKGAIMVGSDADLVMVDTKKQVHMTLDKLHSAAGYSPYEGWDFTGYPVLTIRRGEVVMEDGAVTAKAGTGDYIRRDVAGA